MENVDCRYHRGKIYKLVSYQTTDVYFGSTIEKQLPNRLSKHRAHYKMWLNGKYCYLSSYEIVKHDDCKIILIEIFPCNSKDELCAREQHYIENNDCVNRYRSHTTLTKLEYQKQYYEQNKEKLVRKTY